ncbi:MAG: phage tail sheath family protein [Bacteroides sp.]|nr:phage tail sheath family protein [Bacteroides sp.]
MALGGGTFTVQNKQLPGAYINFVSAASASAELSDRGIVTMPLPLDWGAENEVFEVDREDFQTDSLKLFGYEYTDDRLKGLRDLFANAKTLYAFRLGGGERARNSIALAKYGGARGNDITTAVETDGGEETVFNVRTLVDGREVDVQTVSGAAELKDNDFVSFDVSAELTPSAGIPLSGGTDREITAADYRAYLDKIESCGFNAMGALVSDEAEKNLFTSFAKRMRDEEGIKFQLVLHDHPKADHCGVISVKNSVTDENAPKESLVYWVTGAAAGCEINRSNQNKLYNGEFTVDAEYTQSQLKAAVKRGEFVLHRVGSEIRVLEDINTLVTVGDTVGEVFKDNQTVRVIDQIANDIAVLFNTKYLGVVPNDKAGRVSLWTDIVKHHEQLQSIRAIEDFSDEDVAVSRGDSKKSVVVKDAVTVVNAMSKLYMTVTVG